MQITITPFQKQIHTAASANRPQVDEVTLGDNPELTEIVADTFGWKAITICCSDKETIYIAGNQKGRKIVLLPHFSYGPSLNKETASAVFQELKSQGYQCEWRHTEAFSENCYTEKVGSVLPLLASEELEFERLSSSVKHKIRKSKAHGMLVVKGRKELLDEFYSLYSHRMHALGSPALPMKWFANLLQHYQHGEASIWCVYMGDKAVGAAFMLEYHGFYEACWVATLRKYNKFYSNYALYWHMIQYAVEQCGIRFSFGRSTLGGGVHHFKQQWGTTDIPLVWNYTHPPKIDLRKLSLLSYLWKLLPYPIAKSIGGWFGAWVY